MILPFGKYIRIDNPGCRDVMYIAHDYERDRFICTYIDSWETWKMPFSRSYFLRVFRSEHVTPKDTFSKDGIE